MNYRRQTISPRVNNTQNEISEEGILDNIGYYFIDKGSLLSRERSNVVEVGLIHQALSKKLYKVSSIRDNKLLQALFESFRYGHKREGSRLTNYILD